MRRLQIKSKTLQSSSESEESFTMFANFNKGVRKWLAAAIIFFATLMCLFALGNVRLDAKSNAKELVDRYWKAVTCWDKSVAMHVETEHSMVKKGVEETDIRHWRYDIKHYRDGDRCEWAGHCQFKGKLNGDEYSFNEKFRRIVGQDFFLYYEKRDSEDEPHAFVGSDVKQNLFMLQAQSPDGGFLQGRMGGMGSAAKMVELMSTSSSLRLIGEETLSGSLCYIVEAKTKYGTYTVWIAPEKGYNALKYIVRKSGSDILRDNIHIKDQGITEWAEIVDAIDVQNIDGVFIPVSGRLTGKAKAGGDWERTTHVAVKRSEIVLRPDFEALGAFKINLPHGTLVHLEDTPGVSYKWSKDKKFVVDERNGRIVCVPKDWHLLVRMGKALPGLNELKLPLDSEQIKGKAILVCFFDMDQRPSRRCVTQLAKQADQLKQKDVTIVAVQASKVDEKVLHEWIKKNNITFPVGMIQGDVEKTRFAWCVQSLPWLILTDKEHIIRAEGFALEELDKKIKQAGDSEQ